MDAERLATKPTMFLQPDLQCLGRLSRLTACLLLFSFEIDLIFLLLSSL